MISKPRMNVGAYLEVKERAAFLSVFQFAYFIAQFLEREKSWLHSAVLNILLYKFLVTQNEGCCAPSPLMFMFGCDWKQADVMGRVLNHESDELCSSPIFQHCK